MNKTAKQLVVGDIIGRDNPRTILNVDLTAGALLITRDASGCTYTEWYNATEAIPVKMKRHDPNDECNGDPIGKPCVECGVKVCACERGYGHDCEEA